ncbi:MAG TPA: ATP-binding cassette domain-containing protein [Caproicibacter sp.]|nr:ATP-binding cassette domain-containing protein [Caproicibacter sp.]
MKKELLSIENGKLIKNGSTIFNGLYLHIYLDEIAGIICDDIQTKRYLNEFLLGELELESGRLFLNEKRIPIKNSVQLFSRMVTLINKKSSLVNSISVEENIFLFSDSSFFINRKKYKNEFSLLQENLGINLPVGQKPSELSPKDRIQIELMRAYIEKKKLVILDDLSGYLQRNEIEEIFSVLLKLQKFSMTFLVRIGFEDEYLQKIGRITAIKNSKTISIIEPEKSDMQAVTRRLYFNESSIKLNTKKKVQSFPAKNGPTILEFQNVSTSVLQDISFALDQGKLLKIHCYDELSCSQIVDLLKGEIKPESGYIFYQSSLYKAKDLYSAIHQGVCFMEECAYDSMLFYNMNIIENLGIPCCEKVGNFWMLRKYSESIVKQLKSKIRNISLNSPLKGQKSYVLQQIAYYKWLLYFPKVIVCINPFTDVDIYMRERAIDMIHQYLERGIGVIIVTSNYYTADKFEGETIRISKGIQLGNQ